MSKRLRRVHDTEAFLLRSVAWMETSCVATLFSREYGLVAGIAKGAKRPYSVMRPILSYFQPLLVSWSGSAEVKTITGADFNAVFAIAPKHMMSCWYMNELVLRCLAKEDPHPKLYDEYRLALNQLALGQLNERCILRRFEWYLLQEIGYGNAQAEPDFSDLSLEPSLRKILRERIDAQLEQRDLHTRILMNELRKVTA